MQRNGGKDRIWKTPRWKSRKLEVGTALQHAAAAALEQRLTRGKGLQQEGDHQQKSRELEQFPTKFKSEFNSKFSRILGSWYGLGLLKKR